MGAADAFVWPVRVYYEDTDSGGVVYYANYLKFLERARTEWLRSLGLEQDQLQRQKNLVFMVRSVRIKYLAPAKFNDLLEVHTQLEQLRRVRVLFAQQVLRRNAELSTHKPLCTGTVEVACVDSLSGKPRPLPAELVAEITRGC